MSYNWNDIENALMEDICETYGDADMYLSDYFDVEELKEKINSMSEDEFAEWFTEEYDYDIDKIITAYFDNVRADWDTEYTNESLAAYIFNHLK